MVSCQAATRQNLARLPSLELLGIVTTYNYGDNSFAWMSNSKREEAQLLWNYEMVYSSIFGCIDST